MKFPKLYNPFKVADGDRTFSSFTLSVAILFLVFCTLSVGGDIRNRKTRIDNAYTSSNVRSENSLRNVQR